MTGRTRGECGSSLIEVLVATALMLTTLASVFGMLAPGQGAFRFQPETADLSQRLRVAADVLMRELAPAGSGPVQTAVSGPLHQVVPSVVPYRLGRRHPDAPGAFHSDVITIVHVNPGAAQTTIAQSLVARSGSVQVTAGPGCPDAACGFRAGTDAIVYDDSGSFDLFSIADVAGATVNLQHNTSDSAKTYAAGTSNIAEATSRTLFLRTDAANDTVQLMQYDGAGGADVPVIDHIVGLSFEYFGDPAVASPPELTRIDPGELTDGPWRPDATDPNRYDRDLLRVRGVAITIRLESAAASLRGPAGPLFVRGGTAKNGTRLVPDREIRFSVTPRNLNLARAE